MNTGLKRLWASAPQVDWITVGTEDRMKTGLKLEPKGCTRLEDREKWEQKTG